jgi:hypothetical protein
MMKDQPFQKTPPAGYARLLDQMAAGIMEATREFQKDHGQGNAVLSAVMFVADLAVEVIGGVVPEDMSDDQIAELGDMFVQRVGSRLIARGAEEEVRRQVKFDA